MKQKIDVVLLIILVFFGPVFSYLLPIKMLGKDLFITVIPFLYSFYLALFSLNKNEWKSIFILVIYVICNLVRFFLYNEVFFDNVISNSFIIYIIFFILIFRNYQSSLNLFSILSKVILFSLIFNFINTILFVTGLPCFDFKNELSDDFVMGSRFGGILGGSNVQAHFIAILHLFYLSINRNIGVTKLSVISIISFISVLPTLSRGALAIILFIYFYNILSKFYYIGNIIFLIGLAILLTWLYNFLVYEGSFIEIFQSLSGRLEVDDHFGTRTEKNIFALERSFESINSFFWGIPVHRQSDGVLNISDNSFTLIISKFGYPFSLIFIVYLISYFKINRKSFVFLVVIFFVSFTNNSFLYFQWCLVVIIIQKYFSFLSNSVSIK